MWDVGRALDEYRCETCDDDTKLIRHCPKPASDPGYLARARNETGEYADVNHPDACRVLKLESMPHLIRAIQGFKRWQDQGLGPYGSVLIEQPKKWVRLMQFLEAQEESERANREAEQ